MPERFELSRMREIKESELGEVRARIGRISGRRRAVFRLSADNGSGVIAEIKKASPSEGSIRAVSVADRALRYLDGGAVAVSVLTDSKFFGGSYDDLADVAAAVTAPVLCKEFIYFKEQLDLAYLCGADLALLIARALDAKRLEELYRYALDLGMVPIVEAHHCDELPAVLALKPEFVMVNMRNLATLAIDTDTGFETLKSLPAGIVPICASGIESARDVSRIAAETGARMFLVGTALMRSDDPARMIRGMSDVC